MCLLFNPPFKQNYWLATFKPYEVIPPIIKPRLKLVEQGLFIYCFEWRAWLPCYVISFATETVWRGRERDRLVGLTGRWRLGALEFREAPPPSTPSTSPSSSPLSRPRRRNSHAVRLLLRQSACITSSQRIPEQSLQVTNTHTPKTKNYKGIEFVYGCICDARA